MGECVRVHAPIVVHGSIWVFPAQFDDLEFAGLFLQIYEKVATAFKSEEDVVVANLEADKYRDLAEK